MDTTVFTKEGKNERKISLPEAVFNVPFNANLVHEVVVAMQANARAGTAHTKDRSEVAGGGKKPWRQKGTGRARHGSSNSPIWAGGGVTFGPRSEKDFTKKINKKARAKALASVLSRKYTDGELLVVEKFDFSAPKTADAKTILAALAERAEMPGLRTKKSNAALVILGARDEATEKSFRNFNNLSVVQAKDVNPVDLLTYKYVVISDPDTVLDILTSRVTVTV